MYYQTQMRRALSISLILFFCIGPVTVALGASEDTGLPACCRRHGAHHCAESMRMIAEAAPGKANLTASATCPAFPGYEAANTTASKALADSSIDLPALLAQPHSPAATRTAARLGQIRTRAGRAPPASALT
jgi:hypothetical protein